MPREESCLCGRTLVEGRCASCALAPDVCDCPPVEERPPVRLLATGEEVDGAPSPSPKRRRRASAPVVDEGPKVEVLERLPSPTSYRLDAETKAIFAREAARLGIGVSSLLRLVARRMDWSKLR